MASRGCLMLICYIQFNDIDKMLKMSKSIKIDVSVCGFWIRNVFWHESLCCVAELMNHTTQSLIFWWLLRPWDSFMMSMGIKEEQTELILEDVIVNVISFSDLLSQMLCLQCLSHTSVCSIYDSCSTRICASALSAFTIIFHSWICWFVEFVSTQIFFLLFLRKDDFKQYLSWHTKVMTRIF